MPRLKRKFQPYIYSHDEITNVIKMVDKYSHEQSQLKWSLKIVMPYIIRILYSCGLRISEALHLKKEDVSIEEKFIYIRNSKESSSRYIPLSESLCLCLKTYELVAQTFMKEYYFQIDTNGKISKESIYYHFKKINRELLDKHKGLDRGPNLHSLRHSAAVHRLEKMETMGMDVNQNIYILSVILGHESIKETEVYLHLPYYKFNDITPIEKINDIFPRMNQHEK